MPAPHRWLMTKFLRDTMDDALAGAGMALFAGLCVGMFLAGAIAPVYLVLALVGYIQ